MDQIKASLRHLPSVDTILHLTELAAALEFWPCGGDGGGTEGAGR